MDYLEKNRHHHLPLYFKKFQVTSQIYGWETKELTKSIKFQRNKDYSARITFAKFWQYFVGNRTMKQTEMGFNTSSLRRQLRYNSQSWNLCFTLTWLTSSLPFLLFWNIVNIHMLPLLVLWVPGHWVMTWRTEVTCLLYITSKWDCCVFMSFTSFRSCWVRWNCSRQIQYLAGR